MENEAPKVEAAQAKQSPAYYLEHITAYEREFKTWEGRAKKIVERYRDDKRERSQGARFNVLWSNVQTLKAATFARTPEPDVSRRFKDNDPVGRVAALILERALAFEVSHYRDFSASLRQSVYDRFLGGRGTCWVRYEPTFKQVQEGMTPEDGPLVTEDIDSESQVSEELDFECAPVDYVHWRDFGHAIARTWEETPIVWRKVYMARNALCERFGDEVGEKVPLDAQPEEQGRSARSADSDSLLKRALVYEIWDKDTGQAVWLSKSLKTFLDVKDDPLGLEEFFPCPPPLYATLTTDSLIPVPDYIMYQDQAIELDTLSDRIDGLVKALKMRGVYDSTSPEISRLFTEGENGTLIPVKNWAAFVEKQGLKGSLDLVEILPIAQTLAEAYKAFDIVKNHIYELTGISDILRGQTMASETATAQKIKNSYASLRLKTYQDEVEKFAARLFNLKAQIICGKFDEQTIAQIAAVEQLSPEDQQVVPQALAMLKDGVTRAFNIDISTDSMVYQDEQQEKADRMEFLGAVAGFLEKAVQASTQAPQLIPLAVEMLKFGVRGFRVGKSLEGTIDHFAEQMKLEVAQNKGQNKPSPEQIQAQSDQAKTQAQEQSKQQITAIQEQAETQRQALAHQHEQQMAQFQAQLDARQQAQEQAHQAQIAAMQEQSKHATEQMNQTLQLILQKMKGEQAVEVAEIAAATTLNAAQISAANQSQGAE